MKIRTQYFLALAGVWMLSAITALGQGKAFSQKDFDGLRRLTGTWRGGTAKVEIFEVWKADGAGTLSGLSYRVANGARKDLETVRLFLQNGKIIYAPTTVGQNDEKEVPFSLVAVKGNQYLFENPAHDFPTRISYKFVGKDSLQAYIEGKQGVREMKMYFNYRRIEP